MSKEALTPKFRVSYPNVFEARQNEKSGEMEYSLSAIFPKGADLTKVQAAVSAAITEKWGVDSKKWPKPLRLPFRKAEELAEIGEDQNAKRDAQGKLVLPMGHEEGGVWLRLKSKLQPGLIDANKEDIIDKNQFYAGCYARASVKAFAYDKAGNRGVSLWLQNIQKMGDGEPLAGRPKAQDQFEAITDLAAGSSSDALFS